MRSAGLNQLIDLTRKVQGHVGSFKDLIGFKNLNSFEIVENRPCVIVKLFSECVQIAASDGKPCGKAGLSILRVFMPRPGDLSPP